MIRLFAHHSISTSCVLLHDDVVSGQSLCHVCPLRLLATAPRAHVTHLWIHNPRQNRLTSSCPMSVPRTVMYRSLCEQSFLHFGISLRTKWVVSLRTLFCRWCRTTPCCIDRWKGWTWRTKWNLQKLQHFSMQSSRTVPVPPWPMRMTNSCPTLPKRIWRRPKLKLNSQRIWNTPRMSCGGVRGTSKGCS